MTHPAAAAHPAAHPTAVAAHPVATATQTMDAALLALGAQIPTSWGSTTTFGLHVADLYRVATSAAVLAAVGLAVLASVGLVGLAAPAVTSDTAVRTALAVALACIAAATGLAAYAAKVVHEHQLVMRLAAPEKHEILTGLAYASVGTATLALGAAITTFMADSGTLRSSAGVALAVALAATAIFQAVIASDLGTSWIYVAILMSTQSTPAPRQAPSAPKKKAPDHAVTA